MSPTPPDLPSSPDVIRQGEGTGGPLRHGGRILVDQLALNGVRTVFQVPGESFLAALDGFADHPEIELITCRQEGGAAMAAEAWGKLSHTPGICFVTRGPGACNASAGVHVAMQDSTPMILFVGQIGRTMRGREAFQEVDYRAMFGPLAKWVAEIEDTARIPEYISRAFHVAQSGRPGPVVLALPEDMLSAEAEIIDARPVAVRPVVPDDTAVEDIARHLLTAERPLIIAGGSDWSGKAGAALATFAEAHSIPVAASMRCQSHVANSSACYVGDVGIGPNPKLIELVKDSDCIAALGARIGEMTSQGWSLLDIPSPVQTFLHVYPDASEIGRIYQPDMGLVASPRETALKLGAISGQSAASAERLAQARAAFEAWREPQETRGDLKPEQLVAHLNDVLPADAIFTNGAGNYAGWPQRYYHFEQYITQIAPTSGSMGYGLPAAVAAKLRHRDRTVICFAGDGCMLMNSQELATLAQYDLNVLVIVLNNARFGTIRMHQAREYPGRVSGTEISNPDFAALGRAYGLNGETARTTAEAIEAISRALNQPADSARATVIDCHTDRDQITTGLRLSSLESA